MSKSERQRQKEAAKRRKKAEVRKSKTEEKKKYFGNTFENQLRRLAMLSEHSGQIVKLLMDQRSKEQVAEELQITIEKVNQVEGAFMKLPEPLQDLVVKYPVALRNDRLIKAIKDASKAFTLGAYGRPEFSNETLQRLHDTLKD